MCPRVSLKEGLLKKEKRKKEGNYSNKQVVITQLCVAWLATVIDVLNLNSKDNKFVY